MLIVPSKKATFFQKLKLLFKIKKLKKLFIRRSYTDWFILHVVVLSDEVYHKTKDLPGMLFIDSVKYASDKKEYRQQVENYLSDTVDRGTRDIPVFLNNGHNGKDEVVSDLVRLCFKAHDKRSYRGFRTDVDSILSDELKDDVSIFSSEVSYLTEQRTDISDLSVVELYQTAYPLLANKKGCLRDVALHDAIRLHEHNENIPKFQGITIELLENRIEMLLELFRTNEGNAYDVLLYDMLRFWECVYKGYPEQWETSPVTLRCVLEAVVNAASLETKNKHQEECMLRHNCPDSFPGDTLRFYTDTISKLSKLPA